MEDFYNNIKRSQLEKAFNELERLAPNDYQNQLILLRSRFNKLQQDKRMGILTSQEAEINNNRIVNSLLELGNQIAEDIGYNAASNTSSQNNRDSKRSTAPISDGRKRGIVRRKKSYPREASNIIEVPMLSTQPSFSSFAEMEDHIKILFMSATPSNTGQLNTALESRFKDLIRYFDRERKIKLVEEHGVDVEQFTNFLMHENPHILHYGGHGEVEGIVLEQDHLEADVFESLIQLSRNTKCVLLNACNSLPIAKALAQHVPYVIGTQDVIDDGAAIAFAKGFYMGIVSGKTVEEAFKLGIIKIKTGRLPDADVPILVKGVHSK